MSVENPGYDDTDMTEAELDRELAEGVPAHIDPMPFVHVVGATSNLVVVSASPPPSWVIERFVGERVFGWAGLDDTAVPALDGDQPLANVG